MYAMREVSINYSQEVKVRRNYILYNKPEVVVQKEKETGKNHVPLEPALQVHGKNLRLKSAMD